MSRVPSYSVMVLALFLSACGYDSRHEQDEPTANPAQATGTEATSPATTGTAPEPGTEPALEPARPPAPFAAVTGVAECDRFLDRYRKCLTRLPEEMRPGLETALQAWEGSWKAMAANPVGQGNLSGMCTRAADNAWAAVARFNCPR